jgi:hypothetical protein
MVQIFYTYLNNSAVLKGNMDSLVIIAARTEAARPENRCSLLGSVINLCSHNIQISSGAHPASSLMCRRLLDGETAVA